MNKTVVMRAKKLREYIIAHPGCTKAEIYEAHPGEKLTGGFDVIQRHGLARYEGGVDKGPARWYAKEASVKNHEPVRNDDHE